MRRIGINSGFAGIDKRLLNEGYIGWEKNYLQTLPMTYLLDSISQTSLVGAWGLRKLRSAYAGNGIQVRSSAGGSLVDVGFVEQDLNTSSLLGSISTNNALTAQLYDQSGNERHFAQSTSGSQPRLVNAGSLELINGKPAIFLDGTDDSLVSTNLIAGLTNNNAFTLFFVHQKTNTAGSVIINQGRNASYFHFGITSDSENNAFRWRNTSGDFLFGSNTNTTSQLQIITAISSGGTTQIFRNGTLIGTTANGIMAATISIGDELVIGKRAGSASEFLQGRISIMVAYTRAITTAERQTLEANCSAYYGISLT